MKFITASDFNINPGGDITEQLVALTEYLAADGGDKYVSFGGGTYYIDGCKCKKQTLYITNTAGDAEYNKGETPHLNAVPFYFNNVNNTVIDGNGSVFIIKGKVTNMAIENCGNITFTNIEFRHANPDMHELRVVSKGSSFVDFEIDSDSHYTVRDNKLYFYAYGYLVCNDSDLTRLGWIGLIRKSSPNKIKRVLHPLFSYIKIRDLGGGKIRAYYANTFRFKKDDCFYIFDVRRQFAGIFVNRSRDVVFENIKQRFNYSLALVCQDCENITADSLDFSPEDGSQRKMASVADFVQICMCRGKVVIKNRRFDGAGDDCINVHGIHFKITDIKSNRLTVRFMHPQTHGFNPLRVGDAIAYINPDTLLETGLAVIKEARMLNEYEISLCVSDTAGAVKNNVIEDVDACPDVEFINNYVTRIITRGVLVTTRGNVVIADNRFVSTSMSGVLLSDDAKSWYESGMCTDVNVRNNTFDYCGGTPILIKPENSRYAGAVHRNIKITGNRFFKYSGHPVSAEFTDGILIKDNEFKCGGKIKLVNCGGVRID